MKVSLLNYTQNAINLLIFTKNTRLNMSPKLLADISTWSEEKKQEELHYMARTLPSSWEFVDYVFSIEGVTRAFTHQLVRTRTGSYAQQAMRIVNMEQFGYLTPPDIEADPLKSERYHTTMVMIQRSYNRLTELGAKTEDARGVLPTNILTNICAKFNLRAFSDLVKARLSGRVQDEYREVVKGMVDCVLEVHPWVSPFLFPKGPEAFDLLEAHAKEVKKTDPKKGDALQKAIYHIRTNA